MASPGGKKGCGRCGVIYADCALRTKASHPGAGLGILGSAAVRFHVTGNTANVTLSRKIESLEVSLKQLPNWCLVGVLSLKQILRS